MKARPRQTHLDFEESSVDSGYPTWLEERERAQRQTAKDLGLPLNKNVEVCLCGNVRLQGRLELLSQTTSKDSAASNFTLRIGRATFSRNEIESCVVLED